MCSTWWGELTIRSWEWKGVCKGGGGVEVSLHVILQLGEPCPIRKIPVVKDLPTNIKLCNYYLPQKITAECKTDPKNKEANE